MTQQPMGYPPQGYPQQYPPQQPPPQVQYPQQPPAPAYPAQYGQPVPPQQYGQPQGYPGMPPAQPPVQLAEGSIDAFYSQPSTGTGPSLSWTDKAGQQRPIGTTFVCQVVRDVTRADVQQETDQRTKQPKFWNDGSPRFVMKVPVRIQPTQEFPDGEVTWYCKGQGRDELVRAMSEAGVHEGAPKAGDVFSLTLVNRRPTGAGMNPANVVQIAYQPAARAAQGTGAPSPAPVPEQPVQAPQQPVQQFALAAPYAGYAEQAAQGQTPVQQAMHAQPQAQAPELAQQTYAQYAAAAPGQQPPAPQQYAAPPVEQGQAFGGPVPGFQGQPDQGQQYAQPQQLAPQPGMPPAQAGLLEQLRNAAAGGPQATQPYPPQG